ncbi:MAG: hypothetical protein R3268_00185 [Acidiferrobacterales bacterium]|nr:hypothetical protein [Acidiferrobacterales bacterium]
MSETITINEVLGDIANAVEAAECLAAVCAEVDWLAGGPLTDLSHEEERKLSQMGSTAKLLSNFLYYRLNFDG